MPAKKTNFDSIDTGKKDTGLKTGKVYHDTRLGDFTAKSKQLTATKEEQEARAKALKTQGRKGCKAPHMEVIFTPENIDYLRTISKAMHTPMSHIINDAIGLYRDANPNLYPLAQEVLKSREEKSAKEDNSKK